MKICDFGVSLSSSYSLGIGGTVPYMAPESLKLLNPDKYGPVVAAVASEQPTEDELLVSFGGDVYSMGIMVWEVRVDTSLWGMRATFHLLLFALTKTPDLHRFGALR